MGSTIYYFSSTGNSLDIARKIAIKLENCTIRSMAIQPPNESVSGSNESIGFVFPVFYNGLPRLVKRFVEKLNIPQGTYCFAFINFGGNGANTLGMLDDILQIKGISLSFADEVKMPGNYILHYQAYTPEKVQELIKAAVSKVDKAAQSIANAERKPVKRKAQLLSKIANHIYLYKDIAKWDKKFVVNCKCNSCGLCSKVCPVDNIIIEDRYPVWQHHCEQCLACIQWCPCEAIEYGEKTIGRKRYHNPNVKINDIINECK